MQSECEIFGNTTNCRRTKSKTASRQSRHETRQEREAKFRLLNNIQESEERVDHHAFPTLLPDDSLVPKSVSQKTSSSLSKSKQFVQVLSKLGSSEGLNEFFANTIMLSNASFSASDKQVQESVLTDGDGFQFFEAVPSINQELVDLLVRMFPSNDPADTTVTSSPIISRPADPHFGGNVPAVRAPRKRQQIANMLACCLEAVGNRGCSVGKNEYHIVEFCASSGHIGLPLLDLLVLSNINPSIKKNGDSLVLNAFGNINNSDANNLKLTILDMNPVALETARKRIESLGYRRLRKDDDASDEEDDHSESGICCEIDVNDDKKATMPLNTHMSFLKTQYNKQVFVKTISANRHRKQFTVTIQIVQCMVDQFEEEFDLGIALHACGTASDQVLEQCLKNRASFVVAPCCIGRLGQQKKGAAMDTNLSMGQESESTGRNFQAEDTSSTKINSVATEEINANVAEKDPPEKIVTAKHMVSSCPIISYPRSVLFQELLPNWYDFKKLAQVADWHEEVASKEVSLRRNAKLYVEIDRLRRCFEVDSAMFCKDDTNIAAETECLIRARHLLTIRRMSPPNCTPKNDVLVGMF